MASRVSADSIRTRSTACGFSTRKLGWTDSDFNPYFPLNLANSPTFFKILPRCPSNSSASWGGQTGLRYDPSRWLARERSRHICRTRDHANWTGFGQSESFPGPERRTGAWVIFPHFYTPCPCHCEDDNVGGGWVRNTDGSLSKIF